MPKFKYEGIDGFHASIQRAVLDDPGFAQRAREKEVTDLHRHLIEALRQARAGDKQLRAITLEEATAEFIEPDFEGWESPIPEYLEWCLDREVPLDTLVWDIDRELEFAHDAHPEESYALDNFEQLTGEEERILREEHPLEQVWCEAMQVGIPAAKVVFLCPNCGNPVQVGRDGTGFNPYGGFCCGVCSCDTVFEDDQVEAVENLGVKWWPYLDYQPFELLVVVNPDGDHDKFCELLLEGVPVTPIDNGCFHLPASWLSHALGFGPIKTAVPDDGVALLGYLPPQPHDADPPAHNPSYRGATLLFNMNEADASVDGDQVGFCLDISSVIVLRDRLNDILRFLSEN